MKLITTYIENGRTFYIIEDSNGFWGVEDKDVKETKEGLTIDQEINGINGLHSTSVEECIKKVSQRIQIDALVASGVDRMEAVMRVLM